MKLSNIAEGVKPSITLVIGSQAKSLKAQGKNVMDFSLGEPDFHTPDHVKNAAFKAINDNFTCYTPASGINELKKAISEKFARENNLNYTYKQIVVSNGAKHSLMNVFLTLLNKSDEIIIPAPFWTSYPEMVKIAYGKPVFCKTDESFCLKAEFVKEKITKKTKAILLNSPSNPTGAVIPKSELEKIVKLCRENNIFIISDEVYEHFCYSTDHISPASLGKWSYENTITINSVSKSYSMTGWRIGYAAGPENIISKMSALQSQMTSCPNSISQKAAVIALSGSQNDLKKMQVEFKKRRDYIVKRLNSVKGINCKLPDGAFYVFPKINLGVSSEEFCLRLLQEEFVATIPGCAFGLEGYFRLSYATSMDVIKEGCDRIEKFCENI